MSLFLKSASFGYRSLFSCQQFMTAPKCVVCMRLLSSNAQPQTKPVDGNKRTEKLEEQQKDSEKIEKGVERLEQENPSIRNVINTNEEVIESEIQTIMPIKDVPKHELPVKDIIGKPKEVWWDPHMNRPNIREMVWQIDPIVQYNEPFGLGKLRKKKLRTVKGGHIQSLDETFVAAYETMGPTREAFMTVCEDFRKKSLRGWGFMEFQYVAMEYMKAFNVERDVDAYNQLLNMYPRGPMRQTNYFSEAFQQGFMEQNAALNVLLRMQQMEAYPDLTTLDIMIDVFGPRANPVRTIRVLWYWMPKIRNLNPWIVEDPLPSNPLDTAKIMLTQMCDFDQQFDVLCGSYETADVDPAYLVSSMNEEQVEELNNLPKGSNITVTGPFLQYISRRTSQHYFVLRGDPPLSEVKPRTDEIELNPADFEEGYVFATAITGQPDIYMARLWISELADKHPNISNLMVSFKLTGGSELIELCNESGNPS